MGWTVFDTLIFVAVSLFAEHYFLGINAKLKVDSKTINKIYWFICQSKSASRARQDVLFQILV